MSDSLTVPAKDTNKAFPNMDRPYIRPTKRNRIEAYASIEDAIANWDKCIFVVKDKKKLCNGRRLPGSMYCGNHRPDLEVVTSARCVAEARYQGIDLASIRRVPCPLDPNHTVYEHELKHHVKHMCNVGRRKKELEEKGYYCENCNSINNAVASAEQADVNAECLLTKIQLCYATHVEPELTEGPAELEASVKATVLEAVGANSSAFSKVRHNLQDAYLVQKMLRSGVLTPQARGKVVVVELGAGRGMLGLAIMSILPQSSSRLDILADVPNNDSLANKAAKRGNSASKGDIPTTIDNSPFLVMIERNGLKFKADKILRERSLGHSRIRMDIRHCFLPKLPVIDQCNELSKAGCPPGVVLVAKHLCGLATDLSVRSIQHLVHQAKPAGAESLSTNPLFQGLAIATCCHHACAWVDYTGADWLCGEQGFSQDEFAVMKQWSGWAHTIKEVAELSGEDSLIQLKRARHDDADDMKSPAESKSMSADQECIIEEVCCEHSPVVSDATVRPLNITPREMSRVGKMVKRVLDQGRVEYLRKLGIPARQVRYCDPSLSPECYMIVATNPHV